MKDYECPKCGTMYDVPEHPNPAAQAFLELCPNCGEKGVHIVRPFNVVDDQFFSLT